MRFHEASTVIAATPDAVWHTLVDGAGRPSWDSGVDAVEGRIAPGETLTIRSQAAPGRAFPVTVTSFEAPQRLQLRGGMPLGLFRGVWTYTATADGEHTSFVVREECTGPLLGLIRRSMPELQPSFDRFVQGLEQQVEARG